MNVKAWLKKSKDSWKEAAAKAKANPAGSQVPDGKFIGRINVAEFTESSNHRPQIHWGLVVLEGDYEGQPVHKWDGLDNPDSLYYVAMDLQRLGYDPEDVDPERLEDVLKEISEEKPVVRFRRKTKGDFVNTYFDQMIEDYDGELSEPEEEDPLEDDDEDADEEEDTDDGDGFLVGDRVTASKTVRGKEVEIAGEITAIADDGETVTIKDDEGKVHKKIAIDTLEFEEDEDEEDEEEEEDEEDDDADEEDDDADAEDEDEVDLEVGMAVGFTDSKGKELEGEIVAIDEAAGTVDVKVGKKTHKSIPVADLFLDEEEEGEPEPEPAPAPEPEPEPAPSRGRKRSR